MPHVPINEERLKQIEDEADRLRLTLDSTVDKIIGEYFEKRR